MQTPTKLPYKIAIEIDIDCQELLDAVGLPYTKSEDDDTQNVVWIELTPDEYKDVFNFSVADNYWNETALSSALLNPELGEYTTKVTVYKPNGDNITFE
tara:strand:- start:518 stop:814 length:297 start_codon:yes stop_codon:yes gene_type:complete